MMNTTSGAPNSPTWGVPSGYDRRECGDAEAVGNLDGRRVVDDGAFPVALAGLSAQVRGRRATTTNGNHHAGHQEGEEGGRTSATRVRCSGSHLRLGRSFLNGCGRLSTRRGAGATARGWEPVHVAPGYTRGLDGPRALRRDLVRSPRSELVPRGRVLVGERPLVAAFGIKPARRVPGERRPGSLRESGGHFARKGGRPAHVARILRHRGSTFCEAVNDRDGSGSRRRDAQHTAVSSPAGVDPPHTPPVPRDHSPPCAGRRFWVALALWRSTPSGTGEKVRFIPRTLDLGAHGGPPRLLRGRRVRARNRTAPAVLPGRFFPAAVTSDRLTSVSCTVVRQPSPERTTCPEFRCSGGVTRGRTGYRRSRGRTAPGRGRSVVAQERSAGLGRDPVRVPLASALSVGPDNLCGCFRTFRAVRRPRSASPTPGTDAVS